MQRPTPNGRTFQARTTRGDWTVPGTRLALGNLPPREFVPVPGTAVMIWWDGGREITVATRHGHWSPPPHRQTNGSAYSELQR